LLGGEATLAGDTDVASVFKGKNKSCGTVACSTIPKPTDKGRSLLPRAPRTSTHPTGTSRARNGIKRGRLNGAGDYGLGLGRVILSSLPFLQRASQRCLHAAASPGPCGRRRQPASSPVSTTHRLRRARRSTWFYGSVIYLCPRG